MQIFPESLIRLWNGWEIRVLVLSSLLLQITLIELGARRKYIAGMWISFIVWLAYLSADWLATVALGILASSQNDDFSTNPNYSIHAFWAPFLLLHLGGPDAITSYSLEDNELCLRHFLGLLIEVGVAFYVYLMYLDNSPLTFIAIPVFIAGLVKYGERTWVLRYSSTNQLQESLSSLSSVPSNTSNGNKKILPRGPCPSPSTNFFHRAHYLFKMSLPLFEDLILGFSESNDSHSVISSVSSSEEAFKLVEVELGLIYDELYTKAPIVYSKLGLLLRSISLLSSFIALVVFSITIDGHPQYSTVDIALTYLLLVGAFVLEAYGLVRLIFSDQTMIWLSKSGSPPTNSILRTVYFLHLHYRSGKRWSGLMGQYNLISSCLKNDPPEWLKYFGIDELIKDMDIKRVEVNADVKDAIFNHIRKKGDQLYQHGDLKVNKMLDTQMFRSTLLALRGNGALQQAITVFLEDADVFFEAISFSNSVVIWHLATDICYYSDLDDQTHQNKDYSKHTLSKTLSDYMLHNLVMNPNLLSKENQSGHAFQDTKEAIQDFLFKGDIGKKTSYSEKEACLKILEANFAEDDLEKQIFSTEQMKSFMLVGGYLLAKQLKSTEFEEKWDVVSEVWIEMVAYAASHCDWKEHAQKLRKGGDLLTHVCILMAHFGLSDQFKEAHLTQFQESTFNLFGE
ncbi:hypothetical protein JCGZ_24700 [Jatropha curcas]|uniref:DUF4220 domain-containing protein n=1 Tax=Jatropha curcas TaxID=180498 RepID=A0A067KX00_JATCU|nr:uncharacterized protein LOC105631674 [Jatropha curcas]XP_020533866.1 uncharacterized protein LOC105631674 [Jatropha curcas]KDP40701.1 hypothetical protein JCGZ_24700 [Jatropha curcas]